MFVSRIQKSSNEFKEGSNNHQLSTEQNKSPYQIWMLGKMGLNKEKQREERMYLESAFNSNVFFGVNLSPSLEIMLSDSFVEVHDVSLASHTDAIQTILNREFEPLTFCFFCFFCFLVYFHKYSQFTGQQRKGESISLTPLYHFHPLHRHLDISRVITAESSPLHIAGRQARTKNHWIPSTNCLPLSYTPLTNDGNFGIEYYQNVNNRVNEILPAK